MQLIFVQNFLDMLYKLLLLIIKSLANDVEATATKAGLSYC